MFRPGHLLFSLLILLLLSCDNKQRYKYAIKDFRKPLQVHLLKIVSTGIVDTRGLYEIATNKELIQLSHSEHPVLRASALKVLLRRDNLKPFDILMNHLDDTSMVLTNQGEGYGRMTISDHILREFRWTSQEQRNRTIDAVLTKHNYLRSAYSILSEIKPQEKWYPFIKDMAIRRKNGDSEIELDEFDIALYALAKFKKKEDVMMIRNLMLSNIEYLSYYTWKLMKEMPDTAYLPVYEAYYPTYYYKDACGVVGPEVALWYIKSIANYKADRSANILDSIYHHKPFVYCPNDTDTNYIRHELISTILYNECDAYSKLRQEIEKGIPGFDKHQFQLTKDNVVISDRSMLVRDIPW